MKEHELRTMNVFWQTYQDYQSNALCDSFLEFIHRILDINNELQKTATKAVSLGYVFDVDKAYRSSGLNLSTQVKKIALRLLSLVRLAQKKPSWARRPDLCEKKRFKTCPK